MIRYITGFTLGLILLTSCVSKLQTKTLVSQQYIQDGNTHYATTTVDISDTSFAVNGNMLKYSARIIFPRYTTWMVNGGNIKWYYGDKIVFTDSKGHDFCTLLYLLNEYEN